MISAYEDKEVVGIFIAGKLDRSVQINLVTRAVNLGYRIVPMEVKEFLGIVELLDVSKRDFWKANLDHIWNIHKRVLADKMRSSD